VCAALHINTSRFLDKNEFRNAIQMVRRAPLHVNPFGPPRGMKFRASYICAEIDSVRNAISVEELTSSEWCFFFKHNPHSFKSTARFLPDGRFLMHPWPMPNPESLNWRHDVSSGSVQIHHFPAHRSKRLSNWSFSLEASLFFLSCLVWCFVNKNTNNACSPADELSEHACDILSGFSRVGAFFFVVIIVSF